MITLPRPQTLYPFYFTALAVFALVLLIAFGDDSSLRCAAQETQIEAQPAQETALVLPRLDVCPAVWEHLESLGFTCPYFKWKNAGDELSQRPVVASLDQRPVVTPMLGATLPILNFSPANIVYLLSLLTFALTVIRRLRRQA